jgi:hypothetical protein
MTQKRVVRQNFPSEREVAVKERLKKLAEEKTKTETDSALKPLIEAVTPEKPEEDAVKKAAEAQAALIEEADREEERKRKLAERKKRRRQGSKKLDASSPAAVDSSADDSDHDLPAVAPVQSTMTPLPVPAPAPVPAAPTSAPAVGKPQSRGGKQGSSRQPELYVPRRSLGEEVEDAYVEQVCLQDRVGILTGSVSELQTQMESIVSEMEKLRVENAAMERELQEHQRMEKDVPNLQRRVESLRRELEGLEHQQFRAKQEFEMQSAKKLKPKEEELELACRVLENRRKEEADTSREERYVEAAKEDFENEKLKLREAISLYAVDPNLVTDDFWTPQAPEGLFESANFKKCEMQVVTSFEKERKFQMKRVNDELGKYDKMLKLINEDVMCYFLNNGTHAQYSDEVKQLVRRICLRSQDLHAPKPPPPPPAAPADQLLPPSPARRDYHHRDNRDNRDYRDRRDYDHSRDNRDRRDYDHPRDNRDRRDYGPRSDRRPFLGRSSRPPRH